MGEKSRGKGHVVMGLLVVPATCRCLWEAPVPF